MDIRLYRCEIDPNCESDLEVNFVALVDRPAIERNFLAFKNKAMFEINEDRRIVSGPAMLADHPIYRSDKDLGEYYVVFDQATIYTIVQKFFKKGFGQNFNLMHDPDLPLEGMTIFESFITDDKRGIKPMKGFEDAGEGSWFISAFVENDDAWEKIKSGAVKGFSVEGLFQYVKVNMKSHKMTPEEKLAAIMKLLNETD